MSQKDLQQVEYRQLLRRLRRPMLLVAVLIVILFIVLVVSALSSISAADANGVAPQLSIIADVVVICTVFLPLIICLAIPYMLIMLAIFGVSRLHYLTERGLDTGLNLTRRAADVTNKTADELSQRSIAISTRFAFLDRIINSRGNNNDE